MSSLVMLRSFSQNLCMKNYMVKRCVLSEIQLKIIPFIPPRFNTQQCRQFSVQDSTEWAVKVQAHLIRSLSESTCVEYAQKFLLSVHEATGLPWWVSIVCSTILLRAAVTLPFAVFQASNVAKVENLYLEMPDIAKELKREVAIAVKMYNWDEKTAKYNYRRSVS